MRKICVSLAGLTLALVGCSADNPNACRPDASVPREMCPADKFCSPDTYTCETKQDGGPDGDAVTAVDTRPVDVAADVPVGAEAGTEFRDAAPDKPVDAAADLRAPECTTSAQCTKNPNKPLCVDNACVACGTGTPDAGASDGGAADAGAADGGVASACKEKDSRTPVCDVVTGACVECTASSQCSGSTPLCIDSKCQSCVGATKTTCAAKDAKSPVCGSTGSCVECNASGDCSKAAQPLCVANACVACNKAPAEITCGKKNPGTPACSTSSGLCVQCADNKDCAGNTVAKVCGASNRCVECTQNSDCGDSKPFCDLITNTCLPCTADSQCTGRGPGVCMSHQDGRCASADETAYVQKGASCSASGGTATQPYCDAQQAVDNLKNRRLIVIKGTVNAVSIGSANSQLTIVGQSAAMIAGGADPAVTVTGRDLYMRDITASLTAATGITAQSGAVLRLMRVKVLNCGGGGILLDAANFEISDTLVDGNGPGTFGLANWGGILVNSPPVAGSKKLERVSVTANKPVGVSCTGAVSGTGVLAQKNTGGVDISPTCAVTACGAASVTCGSSLTP